MRDREAKELRIVEAVGKILETDGFRGVGLRAVARTAGVDKRLVSLYFGSVEDLLGVYARHTDHWWTVDELIGDHLPGPDVDSAAGWAALAIKRHMNALRARPLTQEILIWELCERNALTKKLGELREKRSFELLNRLDSRFGPLPPPGFQGLAALLGAGSIFLVLRARTFDSFAGIDLSTDSGWEDVEDTIDAIVTRQLNPVSGQSEA